MQIRFNKDCLVLGKRSGKITRKEEFDFEAFAIYRRTSKINGGADPDTIGTAFCVMIEYKW